MSSAARRLVLGSLRVLALFGVLAVPASAYAPLDQPGPPLSIPAATLQASLHCEPGVRDAKVEPVLLNPATGVTPDQNYSWNWEPALDKLGIPWCAYTAPAHTLGPVDVSGEYLVYAIRSEFALAHRRIAILGHSQGAMSMRWALRFWPDTRAMVDDVIGFAGDNHGTTVISPAICAPGCPAGDWQQIYGANFFKALNSETETFPGISYTDVYSHTDEVVQPDSSPANCTTCLHTGGGAITNIATQDLCPADVFEHLTIGTFDAVAYALGVDALKHPGPADPARIPSSVCSSLVMPGINLANAEIGLQILAAAPGLATVVPGGALSALTVGTPALSSEPGLPCYVTAGCSGAAAPTLEVSATSTPRRLRAGRRTVVHTLVRAREGDTLVAVPGATVRFAGHRAMTGNDGVARLVVRVRRRGSYRLTASRAGTNGASTHIKVVR